MAATAVVIISVKVVSCMFLVPLILFGEPDGDFRGHARFLVPAASTTPLRSAKVLSGESSSGTRLYPRGLSGAILGTGMPGATCTVAACEGVNRRLWGADLAVVRSSPQSPAAELRQWRQPSSALLSRWRIVLCGTLRDNSCPLCGLWTCLPVLRPRPSYISRRSMGAPSAPVFPAIS